MIALGLTVLNALFWLGILFGLPGTWLMVLVAVGVRVSQPELELFSAGVLWAAAGLAMLGEVVEFVLGAAWTRRVGGSRRAAGLSILGGLIGAVLGTAIPVPLLGTLLGACAGAFAGSLAGDLLAGRSWLQGVRAGRAAAVGRFLGTVSKLVLGGALFVLLSVAAFF
ncbi:MAG: DUF456 domain-containing protein [Deltaproteobacteria bacterium]|nr:DUF456 domain-containing protein [Deltaproteobacteria bacterium]